MSNVDINKLDTECLSSNFIIDIFITFSQYFDIQRVLKIFVQNPTLYSYGQTR